MADMATTALHHIVEELSHDEQAYLCAGNPRQAVAWSPRSEITVRIAAKADDELWVLAGSGMLVRFVAASDGDFGDVVTVVQTILAGRAVEMFGDRDRPRSGLTVATGFRLDSDLTFAGGNSESEAAWTARVAGPLAAR